MKYIIVSAMLAPKLSSDVNFFLSKGWKLHGNLFATTVNDTVCFHQPMIYEDK